MNNGLAESSVFWERKLRKINPIILPAFLKTLCTKLELDPPTQNLPSLLRILLKGVAQKKTQSSVGGENPDK